MTLIDKIIETIETYNLIQKGDNILVAVSGGPDSVCLLHILNSIKETYQLNLYGAHLNHNFRGIEAHKDAQYVANLCEGLQVMCFVKSVDVPAYAKEAGLSLEEAGRIQRYLFFDEIAEKIHADKIAVAHNLNDQAETVLMRLIRGAGMQGLGAIQHRRDKIIRPLLNIHREEIEAYCQEHQLFPKIDATNLQPIYHRNRIRLELIPHLEREYNPRIVETLGRTAELLRLDNDFIEGQSLDYYRMLRTQEGKGTLTFSLNGLTKVHPALLGRLFRMAAQELVGRAEILEFKHIESLLGLLRQPETGKTLQLPQGILVKKTYHHLVFTTEMQGDSTGFYYEIEGLADFPIPHLNRMLRFTLKDRNGETSIPKGGQCKAFDYDAIQGKLILRSRREGDRFYPLGTKGSKKLKDFFIDHKIDREKRKEIPLLCDGEEIMWVIGYRMSEKYKITEETKKILLVEYIEMGK